MLEISGDLTITKGRETVELKTNDEKQLVLSFSSWPTLRTFLRAPKTLNSSIFQIREKLKYVDTPIKIEVGKSDSFLLKKGTPKAISISTLLKLIRYSL